MSAPSDDKQQRDDTEWSLRTIMTILGYRPPYEDPGHELPGLLHAAHRLGLTPQDAATGISDALGWPRKPSDDITFTRTDWRVIAGALEHTFRGSLAGSGDTGGEFIDSARRLIKLAKQRVAEHPELEDTCEVPG
jgi:hypothetical protein